MAKKRPLRILSALAMGLFILCIPIFLLTTNLAWAVNSVRLYEYGFNKYDISEATGIEDEELLVVAGDLLHYFNSGEEPIQITILAPGGEELFNEREVAHLRDVKGLIRLCYHLKQATFGYLAVFAIGSFIWQRRRLRPSLAKMALGGGALTIALLLLMGIVALVNFDWLFLNFHRLFFSGNSWILSGYLPQIFPQGFFYDAALFIVGATIVESLVIGGIGGYFVLRRRRARG